MAAVTGSLPSSPENVALAAEALQQNKLVVFPTDTVYGIGCNPFDPVAIDQLYVAKDRPRSKGLPILISDIDQLPNIAIPPTHPRILAWMERFWPGALTLIVERHPDLPDNISPNAGIAVRLPDNEIARAVIRQAGGAVATSSANRSGEAPALTADQAHTALSEQVQIILDGGVADGGIPSTIVDCTLWPPKIVRGGGIPAEQLTADS